MKNDCLSIDYSTDGKRTNYGLVLFLCDVERNNKKKIQIDEWNE